MIRLKIYIVAILSFLPLASFAQNNPPTYQEPSGRTWICHAPHLATGENVPVAGVNGYAGGFWGYATFNSQGWPVIIFDVNQLRRYPLIVARYTYYHECAHLKLPTTDEVLASCEGLQRMRNNGDITQADERILRDVHYSLQILGPQYGGSGKVFWDNIIECAGSL